MEIKIGQKIIGSNHPTYIIAEIGINHEGDPKVAEELIKRAVDCKVDAVKFQTFTAENLISRHSENFIFFKKLELSQETYLNLFKLATDLGVDFLSTPFDPEAVDFLDNLGVPAFKIASGDITYLPLLEHIAKKEKPIILSTGMSQLEEINEAVRLIESKGNNQIILLHCLSSYPARIEDINLRAINVLKRNYPYSVGYSDHSQELAIPLAALGQGAVLIEKHFTLDKNRTGYDHNVSADPDDMAQLVKNIRIIELAQGVFKKQLATSEKSIITQARRSIVAKKPIKKGTLLEEDLLNFLRPCPANGIPVNKLKDVVEKRTAVDIDGGVILRWEHLH
ncbi:MAG: N-acetylneuraminate synthase family protein [bacterium]